MDPNTKQFHRETPDNAEKMRTWVKFSVGEKFTLNDTEFVIRKITNKDMVIRPARGGI